MSRHNAEIEARFARLPAGAGRDSRNPQPAEHRPEEAARRLRSSATPRRPPCSRRWRRTSSRWPTPRRPALGLSIAIPADARQDDARRHGDLRRSGGPDRRGRRDRQERAARSQADVGLIKAKEGKLSNESFVAARRPMSCRPSGRASRRCRSSLPAPRRHWHAHSRSSLTLATTVAELARVQDRTRRPNPGEFGYRRFALPE